MHFLHIGEIVGGLLSVSEAALRRIMKSLPEILWFATLSVTSPWSIPSHVSRFGMASLVGSSVLVGGDFHARPVGYITLALEKVLHKGSARSWELDVFPERVFLSLFHVFAHQWLCW